MAKIIAGIGTSHVPSIGLVHDQTPKRTRLEALADGYKPVKTSMKPDIAIVVYNDHALFFDKYPTFAVERLKTTR